jgi:CBS domain-containing protein
VRERRDRGEEDEMTSATIGDVLKKKGSTVITVEGNEPIQSALELMTRHNIGGVIITNEGAICGIFTERDYLRKVALTGIDPRTHQALDMSSCNLVAVDRSFTVREAMAIMTEQRCRHLPVMEGGRLVGIVSIGDLVKQASEDQETHIRYLTDYVSGKYPG